MIIYLVTLLWKKQQQQQQQQRVEWSEVQESYLNFIVHDFSTDAIWEFDCSERKIAPWIMTVIVAVVSAGGKSVCFPFK